MSTVPLVDSTIHLKQLQNLLHKGYTSQLLFCQELPPYIKIPALISCRMYDEALVQLLKEQLDSPLYLLWVVACSHIVGTDYDEYYEKLKLEKQQKYKQLADDWIKLNKPLHHPPQIKSLHRKKFQQLLLLAQQQSYFTTPKLPVFLLSHSWLQKFYNNNIEYVPAVDNSDLYQSMPWIQSDPKYMHYNYKLKESCRENVHYKIIPFEAWQFLMGTFGGMEFRRFTTDQKETICQLSYMVLKVVVVEDRYVCGFQVFEILVSRFDTIAVIIERIKRIMISYGIIQFQSLSSKWQPIMISNITPQQLINILQDEQQCLLKQSSPSSHQLHRLQPQIDIQDSQYNPVSSLLMFTLHKLQNPPIFDIHSIPYKKPTKKYNKCLTCSTTQDLQQCICKQAYFCCKQCKDKNKEHLKNCENLRKEESIVSRLVDFYGTNKRKLEYEKVRGGGKVGLENLGNTCYMNAALQCVMGVDVLNQFFLSNQHIKKLNVTNVLGSQGHLACAYSQFLKDYYTTNRRNLQPIKILKIISSKNPQFRGYNHQDSQQFFSYFFDKLHQDLNQVRDKPYIQNIESDGRPDQIVSELSWRNYLRRNVSVVSENFGGQYRSEIRCPDCQRISITFDPYLSVTLPFPKKQPTIQLSGYHFSPQGQFSRITLQVPENQNSGQFLQSYFSEPVEPVWLRNKVPYSVWNLKKGIKHNVQPRGVLMFYQRPESWEVEIQYGYEGYDLFHRRRYCGAVQNQQELLDMMYVGIKAPLLRATKDLQIRKTPKQQYLKMCHQSKFLQIVQNSIQQYPFLKGSITVKLRIKLQNLPKEWPLKQAIKFQISSGQYQPNSSYKPPRALSKQLSIPELLQSFSQPQQLTEQNSWYCNKCKQHKLAQKIMSIYRTPKNLVLHLKRFNHRGNRYVIYGEKVKTGIKLQMVEEINGRKYELFGVVNHYGSLSMGHYTAYVKRDGDWYYADDSSFKKMLPEGSEAYLLFYKRID